MNKHVSRLAAAIGIAGLLAIVSPLSAFAATTPTYDTTTDAPIHLVDGTAYTEATAGTQLDWNTGAGIVLSANPVPADLGDYTWATFPVPTDGANTYMAFISPVGSERDKSAWKAYGDSSNLNGAGALLPSVWPAYLGAGDPTKLAAVKSAGGNYSMGIAYLKNNNLTVVKAYYTTINVDAGTGTWTFASPAPQVVNTDIATTTTLAANPTTVEQGATTVLTATVSASKALPTSNVEFYNGATKIGTGAVANGTASWTATVNSVGANTFSAKYVENTVSTGTSTTDTFKASTSADLTVTGTLAAVAMPPKAPSDNVLNANTANGATATYDAATHKVTLANIPAASEGKVVNAFAYSTPTYVGSPTVTGGAVSVSVSTLAAGNHSLAITDTATGDVIAWATFNKSDARLDPSISKQINADVVNGQELADGEFSLINESGATVDLKNPTLVNGASVVSGELGAFKVTDLRQVSKPGWNLQTSVTDFTKGTDTIAASALGIKPKLVSQAGSGATAPILGAEQTSGSASYPWDFAALAGGKFSGQTKYNADLTFTAPSGKPAGTYNSTLTLTLISK